MRTWKKICCPIDFSPSSRKALTHAAELARQASARLVLLHVHQGASAKLRRVLGVSSPELADVELAAAAERLDAAAEKARALFPGRVEAELVAGAAAESILLYARQHHPDALVLARHGGALRSRRRTLGSVAAEVVRRAPCTVVLVRPDALVALG